jgi:hypothetical protein
MRTAYAVAATSVVLCFVGAGVAAGMIMFEWSPPVHGGLERFGASVSFAGDVNQDGQYDVIVGSPWADPFSSPDSAGRAYVYSGANGGILYTLSSPWEQSGAMFGHSVSFAGDVNLDGHLDVVVGAPYQDPALPPWPLDDAGSAYVFDGATGDTLKVLLSPNPAVYAYFGYAVAGVGDVNNDGYWDIAVGAPGEVVGSFCNAGQVQVFSGADWRQLLCLESPNPEQNGYFGHSVAGVGDANQDGHFDIVVGAPYEDPGVCPDSAGRAYIFSGADGSVLHGLTSPKEESEGYFGWSVYGNIDFDADGYHDVIVGAPREDLWLQGLTDVGRAYVFSGLSGDTLKTLISPNPEDYGRFGYSVSWADDVDGGGHSDVIVGAPGESPGPGLLGAGRAYIFNGEGGNLVYTAASPHATPGGWFGCSVSGLADVDLDGVPEVLVGALADTTCSVPLSYDGAAYAIRPWDFTIEGWLTELQQLTLTWPYMPGAWQYLIYGEPNNSYFEPAPENLQCEISQGTYSWTTTLGVGDSDWNFTFIVIAVDEQQEEIVRSNRYGEFDFGTGTPP